MTSIDQSEASIHLTEFAPAHHCGVVSIVAPVNVGQTDRPHIVIKLYLKKRKLIEDVTVKVELFTEIGAV